MSDLNASSAMSANSVGTPMNFTEWINSKYGPINNWDIDPGYGVGGAIRNWLTGGSDKLRDEYDLYKLQNDRQYELAKINDERAWNEYMMSTQYQRLSKDLKAAGLNPGVVLSGGIGASGVPSTSVSSGTNSSRKLGHSDMAGDVGGTLGRLASSALMAIAIVASKGMAAAGKGAAVASKAATQAAKSAKLKADLAAALSHLK